MQKKPSNIKKIYLPKEYITKFLSPLSYFLHIEVMGGLILLVSIVIALALYNSPWSENFAAIWKIKVGFQIDSYSTYKSIQDWINDGLMTVFFFVISLELKRHFSFGGTKKAFEGIFSTCAALGGMIIPVLIYIAFQWGRPEANSWGIVMVTDTSLVIAAVAVLGSKVHNSLRIFLLSLAIVDDVGSIIVVTIFYSHHLDWLALIFAGTGLLMIHIMTIAGIRNFKIYFVTGCIVWLLFDASGVHATITGVILGLMTPSKRWVDDKTLYPILERVISHPSGMQNSSSTKDRETLYMAEIAIRESLSPIERLIVAMHPLVSFIIIPLFIFANANIKLISPNINNYLMIYILIAFIFGKPVGILLFSWLAVRMKIAVLPQNLSWRVLTGGAILAGAGFTMALFISNLAVENQFHNSAKLGILIASIVSILSGLTFLIINVFTRK